MQTTESEMGNLLAERARRLPRAERGCPDSEVLAALALDQLPEAEREGLVVHLESCPDCAFELSVASQARALITDRVAPAARASLTRRWLPMAAALVLLAGGLVVYRLRQPELPTL